jgi:hypothetical protein
MKDNKNKSFGGGANTTLYGKSFELETNMHHKLIELGYSLIKMNNTKYGYYLIKSFGFRNKNKIIYFTQSGVKTYFKINFGITLFRNPDEAYLVKNNNKYILKIIEKKEQHCEGSVETKLWAGPSLKREYELLLGEKFTVEYSYCLNKFLSRKISSKHKKYNILKEILKENDIKIFKSYKKSYNKKLLDWINKI